MTIVATPSSAAPGTRDTNRNRPELTPLLVLGGLAVLSSAALALAYRGGLQVSLGDPIAYLSMARSLAAGHGASLPYGDLYTASPLTAGGPVSHWPVGYPLLLSLDTHSLLSWARVLAVVIYGINVFLFGLLALRTGVARLGSIALAIIFAGLSFEIHGTVQSEPLFFLLVLLGLHAFVSYLNRPSAIAILIVAVTFGLSTVTRFLGESFVISGALVILISLKEPFARRLRDAALLVVVGNIPFLIWYSSVHNAPDSLAVHLVTSYDVKATLYSISGFMVPGVQSANLRDLILAVLVIVPIGILAAVGTRTTLAPVGGDRVNWSTLLFAVVYLLFVFISLSLVDPLVLHGGDDRVLFLPFMLVLLWCAQNWPRIASWSTVPRHWLVPTVSTMLVGLLVVTAIWKAVDAGRSAQTESVATPSTYSTGLKLAAASLPANTIIYSNEPDVVYFLTGRKVYLLPNTINVTTLKANHHFVSEMSALERRVCGKRAAVLFSLPQGLFEPSLAQVQHELKIASQSAASYWGVLNLDTNSPC